MSQRLVNRNDDLRRLREDRYEVRVRKGYLLLSHVPYVNSKKEVKYGTLVSNLHLAGDKTLRPDTHVAYFVGEYPCDQNGAPIDPIRHQSGRQKLADEIEVDHSFSSRPKLAPDQQYADYYEKMKTYVAILSAPASILDATATATSSTAVIDEEDDSPFVYTDTNSSRAEINAISHKLNGLRIGIVGLGGTGSYVLDLVAKTEVAEIHLFDGDQLANHNAFRAPGAATKEELEATPLKTDYYSRIYSAMHKGVRSHPYHVTAQNVDELAAMDFVFVCADKGEVKKVIFQRLESAKLPFIDVGLGLEAVEGKLRGTVRTTTSTPQKRDHVPRTVSLRDEPDDVYQTNIQIAELNALNATFAVIRWKKYYGFYHDFEHEHSMSYTIDNSLLLSNDCAT